MEDAQKVIFSGRIYHPYFFSGPATKKNIFFMCVFPDHGPL